MKISLGAKTLLYPTPVMVVGSYSAEGLPNVMTASWGGICCSDPPCLAVSIREARMTHGNIVRNRAFTVSLPSSSQAAEADYIGMVSGRDENKFEKLGLTAVLGDHVEAPYVGEFPMVIECRLLHTFELGAHTQFVGQIVDVKVDDSVLTEEREIDLARLRPILYAPGVSTYYEVGEALGRAYNLGKEKS
ncbi:MAG: flavin reductase family protein [FCB group bacterium]|nr:flavin reductase family protein [FCB group bacterium]